MSKIYYDNFYEVPTEEHTFYVHRKIWVDNKGEGYEKMGVIFEKEFFTKEDCKIVIDPFYSKKEISFSRLGLDIKVSDNDIKKLRPSLFFLLVKNSNIEEIGNETKAYLVNKSIEEQAKYKNNEQEKLALHV